MKYKVVFPTKRLAEKFYAMLENINDEEIRKEIKKQTLALGNDPRPYGNPKIKPPVEVYSHIAQYRIRIGPYRVLYDIDDKRKKVWIFALRRRNESTYR